MAWSDIFGFMCARDEGFAKTVIPVPPAAIATLQRECGIELPTMYAEMLATLGEDAAGYHPFGPTQDHDFYRLVELLPPKYYPGHDYFKVSRCTSFDIEPEEYYLDLTRAAGDDTPLVYIDFHSVFSRELVHDLHLTLAEMLTRTAFSKFELERKPYGARLLAHAESPEQEFPLRDLAVGYLSKHGMKTLLPAQPRVVGLGDGVRAAKLEVSEQVLVIELGAPDAATVERMVEQLLDHVPDAERVK